MSWYVYAQVLLGIWSTNMDRIIVGVENWREVVVVVVKEYLAKS